MVFKVIKSIITTKKNHINWAGCRFIITFPRQTSFGSKQIVNSWLNLFNMKAIFLAVFLIYVFHNGITQSMVIHLTHFDGCFVLFNQSEIITINILFLSTQRKKSVAEDRMDAFIKATTVCQKDTGASADDLKDLMNRELPSTKEGKCLRKCVMEKMDMVSIWICDSILNSEPLHSSYCFFWQFYVIENYLKILLLFKSQIRFRSKMAN